MIPGTYCLKCRSYHARGGCPAVATGTGLAWSDAMAEDQGMDQLSPVRRLVLSSYGLCAVVYSRRVGEWRAYPDQHSLANFGLCCYVAAKLPDLLADVRAGL